MMHPSVDADDCAPPALHHHTQTLTPPSSQTPHTTTATSRFAAPSRRLILEHAQPPFPRIIINYNQQQARMASPLAAGVKRRRQARQPGPSLLLLAAALTAAATTSLSSAAPVASSLPTRPHQQPLHARGGSSFVPAPPPQQAGARAPRNLNDDDQQHEQQQQPPPQQGNYAAAAAAGGPVITRPWGPASSSYSYQRYYSSQPASSPGERHEILYPRIMRTVGNTGVCILFMILTARATHLYELADQISGAVRRALVALPVVGLLCANLVGVLLSLVQSFSRNSRIKTRLKAILTINGMAELLQVAYNSARLVLGNDKFTPREAYVGRIFTSVWILTICYAFSTSRWDNSGQFQ